MAISAQDGAIIGWRSLGDKTDRTRLETALQNAGVTGVDLRDRTWRESLRKALGDAFPTGRRKSGAKHLVRPCRGTKYYTVVTERPAGEDENSYSTEVSFGVDDGGMVAVTSGYCDHAKVVEVQQLTVEYHRHLPGEAVAAGVVGWVNKAGGVPMRDGGGVYYLPAVWCDQWRVLTAAVERAAVDCQHKFWHNAFVMDEASAMSLKETVIDRFKEEAAEIVEECEGLKHQDSIDARRTRAIGLRLKMGLYQQILGDSLREIEDALEAAERAAGETVAAVMARDVYMDAM